MPEPQTVLLVGGTGHTGQRALRQLLHRGVNVRAIVRARGRLPADVAGHPGLAVIEASLLELSDEELRQHLDGCAAVVSCLGHPISFKGVFGPPRDLVTRATTRLCRAIAALAPAAPVKLVLMSSVSVHRSRDRDARRGVFERAFLWLLRGVIPPARDNQRAADFLVGPIAASSPFVEWVALRPDSLLEGAVAEYAVHEGLVNSIFSPGTTRMDNVAHFICELVTDPETWAAWRSKLPVIVDVAARPG